MGKLQDKRSSERRKKPRGKQSRGSQGRGAPAARSGSKKAPVFAGAGKSVAPAGELARETEENCIHCSKDLKNAERALFVEEEVGRIFCAEDCITAYFAPEIERLEKEYFRYVSPGDLNRGERDKLAHLKWVTLQEPDEIWRQKTLSGDYRYTLISEFQPGRKTVWFVCICLFLRGEPSFLYLAFPTKNSAMVNHYRRGERVVIEKAAKSEKSREAPAAGEAETPAAAAAASEEPMIDGLADEWTTDETFRAQLYQERRSDDIPVEEFRQYESCLEETLEVPDEVWSVHTGETEDSVKLYHFLRHYPREEGEFWFVVVARETENEEEIEILDAFPTRDHELYDRYRTGSQEVGEFRDQPKSPTRVVH